MAEWDVVNETPATAPAAAPATDPWAVASEEPQGRGWIQALKDYPAHFLNNLLETPKAAFEAAHRLTYDTPTAEDAGTMLNAAMLGGVGTSAAGVRLPLKLSPKEGEVAPVAEAPKPVETPPVTAAAAPAADTIRFYHGEKGNSPTSGGARWFTPWEQYARDWARSEGAPENTVHYVDIPKDQVIAHGGYDEINGRPRNFEAPEEIAKQAKPLSQAAAVEQSKVSEPIAAEWAPVKEEPLAGQPLPPEQAGILKKASSTVEKIFSPDTVSPIAEEAGTAIRAGTGQAARDTATTAADLGQYQKVINELPVPDRLNLIDYIERRSSEGAPPIQPELKPVADAIRDAMEMRKAKVEALPSKEQAQFVTDYFPHFWKDPKQASDFARQWMTKEGSGRNLKGRTIPTIADGIKAGLEPITTDPIAAATKYAENMDRFVATTKIFDDAVAKGTVKKLPEGALPSEPNMVQVETRRGNYYAPEDWARVYNNFTSRGFHGLGGGEYGAAYDALRRGSGAVTSLELGLSGYHALTMAQESMVNSVANAISSGLRGKMGTAGKALLTAPAKPVTLAMKGHKLEQTYLGKGTGDPYMEKIADLLTEAGGRGKGGKNHALDYEYSRQGSYVTAFKKAALKNELMADLKDVQGRPLVGTAKVVARHVGRIMDTVSQPLFEKYIPKMKNGAFYENMGAWLERNPGATKAEQVKAAQSIWDSVDNRFGEMVQDNIFWDKFAKQSAMLALRSFSWTLGGPIREIGGGLRDIGRLPMRREWTDKASYVIALPFTFGLLNATYQYLKTGKAPESMQDLMAPQTGGTVPSTRVDPKTKQPLPPSPERIMMPGYMKDVFGFAMHPVDEIKNKEATAPRMAQETLSIANGAGGSDWRGDPIISPRDVTKGAPEQAYTWLKDYLGYLQKNLGPITLRQMQQGTKKGSNLNPTEQALGVKTAPSYLTDPEGYTKMMEGLRQRGWTKKQNFDKRQKQLYGGFE